MTSFAAYYLHSHVYPSFNHGKKPALKRVNRFGAHSKIQHGKGAAIIVVIFLR